jgi:hypothetical protein
VAFTPGVRCVDVRVDGDLVVENGKPTRFDMNEIRSKAFEATTKLHKKLALR